MARSIKTIYDSMISEKETHTVLDTLQPVPDTAQTFLDDLTTTSKVAFWRLYYFVIAVAIYSLEILFDAFTASIELRALEIIAGTERWYVALVKSFQFGDDLIWDGTNWVYESTTTSTDEAKRIVTQASSQTVSGVLNIKAAKGEVGSLMKLTSAETAALESFLDDKKFAGTNTLIITDDTDLILYAYNVYYDAAVLAADGSLLSDATTFPVADAIEAYIQGLPFGGVMRVAGLTDAIQAATGVLNVVATSVEAKYGAIPYADILALPNQSYTPNAGWLNIDGASVITYEAA